VQNLYQIIETWLLQSGKVREKSSKRLKADVGISRQHIS